MLPVSVKDNESRVKLKCDRLFTTDARAAVHDKTTLLLPVF